MKQAFFVPLVATVAVVLGVVAAANVYIDVNGVYHRGQQRALARDYVARLAHAADGLSFFPYERAFKLELARSSRAPCYVTGSSHEFTLSVARVPGLAARCATMVNLGVSGGSFEDALIQLAALKSNAPATVLIGIDPWFFHLRTNVRWLELQDAYGDARTAFELERDPAAFDLSRFENLISFDYLERNVEAAMHGRGQKTLIINEAGPDGANLDDDTAFYAPDGSLTYSRAFRASHERNGKVDCADLTLDQPLIEAKATDDFAKVLRRLTAADFRPILLMMPYNPAAWDCSASRTADLQKVEAAVQSVAERAGVMAVGSYDGRRLGLTRDDFYDSQHVNIESLGKLSPLFASP